MRDSHLSITIGDRKNDEPLLPASLVIHAKINQAENVHIDSKFAGKVMNDKHYTPSDISHYMILFVHIKSLLNGRLIDMVNSISFSRSISVESVFYSKCQ